ncbi:sporulation-control protein [Streptomyces sp. V3I8]|uniref:sporulation protein n=1 Tax=Streptomyces sp. V3I8 TaxID=3042279 RepID=UPI00277D9E8C|nr:sporulation protein [Streptomyces sp. V3I8]MDQ1037613.1 sporulation-control protein [Streptomyces sp. V3I8]
MEFERLPGSLGVGGPTVDTVLGPGPVLPGGTLSGEVRLAGGDADVDIERIALELVARVGPGAGAGAGETNGAGEGGRPVVFERFTVCGGFRLGAGAERTVPFDVALPWETPVTEVYGREVGITLGLRTELSAAGARDDEDDPDGGGPDGGGPDGGGLDRLVVTPRPAQEAILEAFGQLGFGFRSAGLEPGRIGGTGQQLPFRQELELTPSAEYAHAVREIELTFLAAPAAMEVVLEADKRGGRLSAGDDTLIRFTVPHSHGPAAHHDWNTVVDGWVRELVEHRESYGPDAAYGHDRSAPGIGTTVALGTAGLAVGLAGGLVAAEAADGAGGEGREGREGENAG